MFSPEEVRRYVEHDMRVRNGGGDGPLIGY